MISLPKSYSFSQSDFLSNEFIFLLLKHPAMIIS